MPLYMKVSCRRYVFWMELNPFMMFWVGEAQTRLCQHTTHVCCLTDLAACINKPIILTLFLAGARLCRTCQCFLHIVDSYCHYHCCNLQADLAAEVHPQTAFHSHNHTHIAPLRGGFRGAVISTKNKNKEQLAIAIGRPWSWLSKVQA